MKFSITVPAYKSSYLKECIDSILAQTYQDYELIIVNDASPENLDSIVESYSDARIQYYKNKKNCGAINVVDNWNRCLSYATGDYIICMGDDDKLLPDCLEEYSQLIMQYPGRGVYHGWAEIIDENSNVVKMQAVRPLLEDVYSIIWHRWHGRDQFIGDFLFETKRLKENGGFYKLPLAWGTDDITVVLAAKNNGIVNSQKPIFQYRVNSQTISISCDNLKKKMDAISLEEKWFNFFLQEKPSETTNVGFVYWKMVKDDLSSYMQRKKRDCLKKDFLSGNRIFKLTYWIKHRKQYGITLNIILHAFLYSYK